MLLFITFSHSSISISCMDPILPITLPVIPLLLNKISGLPIFSTTFLCNFRTPSYSDRSAWNASALTPSEMSCFTSSWAGAGEELKCTATFAPCLARIRAEARPMPPLRRWEQIQIHHEEVSEYGQTHEAPVMSASLPVMPELFSRLGLRGQRVTLQKIICKSNSSGGAVKNFTPFILRSILN